MRETSFPELVRTAHGCVLPDVATHCVEDAGDVIHYDVYLLDWNVRIEVPMPVSGVVAHLFVMDETLDEHVDLDPLIRRYKVRALEAVAHALCMFENQPIAVQQHLRSRFGPMLDRARRMGREWWRQTTVRSA